MIREAINCENKRFLWNHFIKWWPPSPFYEVSIYSFFRPFFERIFFSKIIAWGGVWDVVKNDFSPQNVKKKLGWKSIWKNKIDPPPFTKLFHNLFHVVMASTRGNFWIALFKLSTCSSISSSSLSSLSMTVCYLHHDHHPQRQHGQNWAPHVLAKRNNLSQFSLRQAWLEDRLTPSRQIQGDFS